MGLITCKDITKKFGNFNALTSVNLDIPEGKIFGFLGPNGAGKTTLIRIINRITLPTSGELLFKGKTMQLSDIERIGYLPEERGLYKKMKIGEQAIYLARLKGMSRSDATRELQKWFMEFGIQPWWNKKLEELSKGMAQKIQFIITVVHKPSLIILDEPFSGFDPINVDLIRKEILKLRDNGATIILSTHNMESVEELCDNIALINKSKVVITGEVEAIRKEHGKNRVEVVYNSEQALDSVPSLFSVLSSKEEKDGRHSILEVVPGTASRSILNEIVPKVDIISYQALMPRMNDIFIKLVKRAEELYPRVLQIIKKTPRPQHIAARLQPHLKIRRNNHEQRKQNRNHHLQRILLQSKEEIFHFTHFAYPAPVCGNDCNPNIDNTFHSRAQG
jgi:ABC-2 type transport system ATP-binding protein